MILPSGRGHISYVQPEPCKLSDLTNPVTYLPRPFRAIIRCLSRTIIPAKSIPTSLVQPDILHWQRPEITSVLLLDTYILLSSTVNSNTCLFVSSRIVVPGFNLATSTTPSCFTFSSSSALGYMFFSFMCLFLHYYLHLLICQSSSH